jgi:uncharacterized protein YjiS (DUF1127 family)
MNMRLAKDELSLLNPSSLSQYVAAPGYGAVPASKGFFAMLRSAARWVAELPERDAAISELSALSDRELADIGLSRADVPRIFEPDFKPSRV